MQPTSHDYEFDDWPVQGRENDDVTYVGRTAGVAPDVAPGGLTGSVFYDRTTGTLFSGEIDGDEERIVSNPDAEIDVDPGETLGDALERVGEKTGWDALSEFAQDHLESEEETSADGRR